MTGEQTTLVLGLVVFGLLVVLLSRSRTKSKATPSAKSKSLKPTKKRRR